jgi:predicted ATPase
MMLLNSGDIKMNKNKKAVIIGSSCSGKTTLLNELSSQGYLIQPEIPRMVLEQFPTLSPEQRQVFMYRQQLTAENSANGDCIFERGIPDIVVYTDRYAPTQLHRIVNHQILDRYNIVFHLDTIENNASKFNDGVRVEGSVEESIRLDKLIRSAYKHYTNDLVFIESSDLDRRVNEVISYLDLIGFRRKNE